MKSPLLGCVIGVIHTLCAFSSAREYQDGDIIFCGSPAGQGAALILATGSTFTHCGIVFRMDGDWWVLEAVQPVRITSISTFLKERAEVGPIVVRRLKTPVGAAASKRAREWAAGQIGKNYDLQFRWDDDKLYCSELVWKLFQHAGVELCPLRHFADYKLDDPKVKQLMTERRGGADHFAKDEPVVAPSDLAASPLMVEVP